MNNIIGARVDVPARQVELRPFCPWPEFSWAGCRLGRSRFDFAYRNDGKRISGSITNRNDQPYTGAIELVVPDRARLRSARLNGVAAENVGNTVRFRRPAARISRPIAPGESARFEVEY